MATTRTANDPRHYTSRDGRILPVGGTHADHEPCTTCDFAPTKPTAFVIGQKVEIPLGPGRRVRGLIVKVGRIYAHIAWRSSTGRRHESRRRATEVRVVRA